MMKILGKMFITLTVLVALPLTAAAMQHGDHNGSMDHSNMENHQGAMDHGSMGHDGMAMKGDMIMLGDAEQDGVKAMAHLKDVKDAMAKMGMKTTHHIMVMFVDQASGKPIDSGNAAVKVKGADGKESEPVKLMGMQGHFGADIELPGPGQYHFTIGTKLADGKKRQFDFDFTLK